MLTAVHVVMTALHDKVRLLFLLHCIDTLVRGYIYASCVIVLLLPVYTMLDSQLITIQLSHRCFSRCDVISRFACVGCSVEQALAELYKHSQLSCIVTSECRSCNARWRILLQVSVMYQ
jgi:hypothetical protein